MDALADDSECCRFLIDVFSQVFPALSIRGEAEEPFYEAPKFGENAILHFRSNFPRSLLHEIAHYCLAGDRRRQLDDFGYWYSPCGRSQEEQAKFEAVEARPQGLEKALCEIVGLKFSPSLDDFSGRLPDVGGVGAEVMQQWYKACAGGAVHCRVMNLGHYRKTAFRKVANAV